MIPASEVSRLDPGDTLPVKRCGCVPQLGVLYEDEDPVPRGGSGWAKKIPLLGPFWCVRNTHSTTVRRRDNAVYRSNSFKFERRAPVTEPHQQPVRQSSISNIIDQVIQTKKPNRVSRTKKEESNNNANLPQEKK